MVNSASAVKGYVAQQIAGYKNDPEFIANGWALRIAEEVDCLLKEKQNNQTWLGTQMGVSRARVSFILNASPNITLLTLAKLSVAIGVPAEVSLNAHAEPIEQNPSRVEDKALTGLTANHGTLSTDGGRLFANVG